MTRAANCHSSCTLSSSCFLNTRSAIMVTPLGSLGRRRRANEPPLLSEIAVSLLSKEQIENSRAGNVFALNTLFYN